MLTPDGMRSIAFRTSAEIAHAMVQHEAVSIEISTLSYTIDVDTMSLLDMTVRGVEDKFYFVGLSAKRPQRFVLDPRLDLESADSWSLGAQGAAVSDDEFEDEIELGIDADVLDDICTIMEDATGFPT